jgi:aromatic-L-amino-acid/L-tryptophan decarboxylase
MPILSETEIRELTLDPDNWENLRSLGHRMVDDIFDHLSTLREQPAWQPVPEKVRTALHQPVPTEPTPAESVYEEFLANILPYTSGNRHPRAWGWVRGNGTPLAMLADMLASGINAHLAGGEQAPTLVEEQVLDWLRELMGMPVGTSGILTSGGTMANLLGLAVARQAKAGFDLREEGLQGHHPRLMVYWSDATHMWAQKAMELLGLGKRSLCRIPADADGKMNLTELQTTIQADRDAGAHPIAVIGNLGTVNTGAVDDLSALAEICKEQSLWFHVDGAFGALLALSSRYRHLTRGMELADSLAFDLHKWISLPFDIGCTLIRDAQAHTAAFATPASYLETTQRGMLAGGIVFSDRGIELTRNFKALKVWMSLKTHGVSTYAALIERNVEQAAHLSSLVQDNKELELLVPRTMNVVCFRYRPETVNDQGALNRINREIVLRLQESGQYVISGTTIHGNYAIRIANVNHRSRLEDFDALAGDVIATGRATFHEMAY